MMTATVTKDDDDLIPNNASDGPYTPTIRCGDHVDHRKADRAVADAHEASRDNRSRSKASVVQLFENPAAKHLPDDGLGEALDDIREINKSVVAQLEIKRPTLLGTWKADLDRRAAAADGRVTPALVGERAAWKAAASALKKRGLKTEDVVFAGFEAVKKTMEAGLLGFDASKATGGLEGYFYRIAENAIKGAFSKEVISRSGHRKSKTRTDSYCELESNGKIAADRTSLAVETCTLSEETAATMPAGTVSQAMLRRDPVGWYDRFNSTAVSAVDRPSVVAIISCARLLRRITAVQEDAVKKLFLELDETGKPWTQAALATLYGCSQSSVSDRVSKALAALKATADEMMAAGAVVESKSPITETAKD